MLPAPRVIAIDDEPKHLEGLTQGLNGNGTACLPIHFTGETTAILPCPHVRVIFADLHLSGGTPRDHAQDFSMIGSLIESTIKPSGPYLIVLWTRYPEQADALRDYLEVLEGVPQPFAVKPLDKKDYLDSDGTVRNIEQLGESIAGIVSEQPQLGALLNWEDRVLDATGDTVSSIVTLAASVPGKRSLNSEVSRLLASFAVAAVGKKHVEEDRFRAVNEALLPILADRIAAMRSREDGGVPWQAAFQSNANPKLSLNEAAKLNTLIHIALPVDASRWFERGAVIALADEVLWRQIPAYVWPFAGNCG